MVALMILLAFSGLTDHTGNTGRQSSGQPAETSNMLIEMNNNLTILNQQEIHDFQEFMNYNLIHYGIRSSTLDVLQYMADMNFATWYMGNYSQVPSSYRGITPQNASVMLPIWENESPQAQADVQAVANYEVNQYTEQNEINTSYIVNNHLGYLVSNETEIYNNQSVNVLVYKYTKNNQSLVYELIDRNGHFTPVDPYIRLNAFTIHWGWLGLISGTSYNIYLTFTNYNDALNFKNFLVNTITMKSSVNCAFSIIAWVVLGAAIGSAVPGAGTLAGAIVGLIGGVYTAIQGNTNPFHVNQKIDGLFTNQEDYNGYFNVTYTLNAWEYGLVPEFSWWGYMNPGQVLTQIYKNVELASSTSTTEGDFMANYNYLSANFGTNVETYFAAPNSWSYIASILEGWT